MTPPIAPKGATPVRLAPMSTYTLPGRPKVGRNVLSCLLMLVIAFVIILVASAYVIARTGVVRVPYFSQFYRPIAPTRVVDAEAVLPADFSKKMQERLLVASTTAEGLREIVVTEAELTGALRGAVAAMASSSGDIRVQRIQAVMSTSSVELSGVLVTKIGSVNVIGTVIPIMESDGRVSVVVQKVYVGELPLSSGLVERLRRSLISRGGATWDVKAGPMNLKDIHLQDGSVRLAFDMGTSTSTNR